jgi:hypothetical protein
MYKNRISKINLNVENLSINDYNNLLINKLFYDIIPTEYFLIFQTDSMICESNKELINNFIKYDYVGAPWKYNISDYNESNIGNGGLSLRKKNAMIECIKNNNYKNENEDMFFANCKNLVKPSFDDAKKFSIESIYENQNSFGVHKPWDRLNKDEMDSLNKTCKGLNKLAELNN